MSGYIFTKPDPGPSPLLDAPTIQNNFAAWASVFANNHSAMNTATQGDHTNVIMTLQSSGPPITQDLAVLFAKNATATTGGTKPQLFVKVPQFLPDSIQPNPSAMQLTYNQVSTAGPQYQSFLPGGYILYWGSTNNIAIKITLSPAPTKILVAIATANNLTSTGVITPFTVATNITSSTQFQIFSNATGSYTFGWYAIGSQ